MSCARALGRGGGEHLCGCLWSASESSMYHASSLLSAALSGCMHVLAVRFAVHASRCRKTIELGSEMNTHLCELGLLRRDGGRDCHYALIGSLPNAVPSHCKLCLQS